MTTQLQALKADRDTLEEILRTLLPTFCRIGYPDEVNRAIRYLRKPPTPTDKLEALVNAAVALVRKGE